MSQATTDNRIIDILRFRHTMGRVAQLLRWRHRNATAILVQLTGRRTELIAVLGTDEDGNGTELWHHQDWDDWSADMDPVTPRLTAATPHATHETAGELRWTRHDNATYRAPLPPAPRPRPRLYVDSAATPSPPHRQVMPSAATSTCVDGDLPRYPASMSPAEHCVPTGLALLDHVVLGRFGDTVLEAVSYNGGHTLLGFLTVTDGGRFHAAPRDPGLDPVAGPRPGGVDVDEATSALLATAADAPRQWSGPFDSRGLAEAFLLGWAGGTGLLALVPPAVPDEEGQEELTSRLSSDEIAGIGSSLVGRPVHLPGDYDVLAIYELPDTGCQVVLVRDVRGLYAFVCGCCEHGDFADCPHLDCPVGYCDRGTAHKIGYSFDCAGATAWHRTEIGR
ncbi:MULTISPECIES: hypothetical protein [Actinosynnema]|uniref:hypothetical protein n=1 Tax=Actinosynnema TaxID=40566 RepID=UPI0020A5BF9A|nr:hypothetical protein [Actinosynnema pretiosum]MCP2097494.1 hypothetical protein [Actinosynnema pretiosum]